MREFQPIWPLGQWVTSIQGGVPPPRRLILPHDGCAIVFRRLRTENRVRVSLHALGPTTCAIQKDRGEVLDVVTVRLRSGYAREIFGAPVREFAGERIELCDGWGHQGFDLREELAEQRQISKCVDLIQRALICRLERHRDRAAGTARLARKFSDALSAGAGHGGRSSVADVAATLGLSSRQVQRTCVELFGLPPKTYLQLRRFQLAVRMAARVPLPDWAEVAAHAGYFDQAHLIAAFKRFAGRTPENLMRDSAELVPVVDDDVGLGGSE